MKCCCKNTHRNIETPWSKISACCRHGDIDISGKNSKSEAVTPSPGLFWALDFFFFLRNQLNLLGFFVESFSPSPLFFLCTHPEKC